MRPILLAGHVSILLLSTETLLIFLRADSGLNTSKVRILQILLRPSICRLASTFYCDLL